MRENLKSGDEIVIKVDGRDYKTIIDVNGVQRFVANGVIDYLSHGEKPKIDFNDLAIAYHYNKFSQRDYLEFYMSVGYSVCGIAELNFFEDLEIINPLWEE